jgi:hypothetical protein
MGQPVMQWQILAKDPDQVSEFYCKLFGWTVNADNALGYRMIDTGSECGIKGGVWPSPPEGHSLVQLFIEIDDMTKSVELGANVIIPPQKLPDGDELAIILGPEGVPFGMFKPA